MQSTQGMEQTTTAPAMEGVEPSDQQEQDGSPHKRGRVQDQPLTLALLKEVLAQERHADRESTLPEAWNKFRGTCGRRAGGHQPNAQDHAHAEQDHG